jgi:hypothetical protein
MEAASKLADTAGGNPLFIEQLAATMAESSAVGGSLPTTIRGILARGSTRFPPRSVRSYWTPQSSARRSGAARSSGSRVGATA